MEPSTPVTCEHCERSLIDFIHDELEASDHVVVARHLASCSSCALASCRLRADLEGIAAVADEAPGAHVRAQLRARVVTEFTPRPGLVDRLRRVWSRPIPAWQALGLAAAPAVVLSLVWWGPSMQLEAEQADRVHALPEIERVDAGGPLRDALLF